MLFCTLCLRAPFCTSFHAIVHFVRAFPIEKDRHKFSLIFSWGKFGIRKSDGWCMHALNNEQNQEFEFLHTSLFFLYWHIALGEAPVIIELQLCLVIRANNQCAIQWIGWKSRINKSDRGRRHECGVWNNVSVISSKSIGYIKDFSPNQESFWAPPRAKHQ